jgi:hypothetical protein
MDIIHLGVCESISYNICRFSKLQSQAHVDTMKKAYVTFQIQSTPNLRFFDDEQSLKAVAVRAYCHEYQNENHAVDSAYARIRKWRGSITGGPRIFSLIRALARD